MSIVNTLKKSAYEAKKRRRYEEMLKRDNLIRYTVTFAKTQKKGTKTK